MNMYALVLNQFLLLKLFSKFLILILIFLPANNMGNNTVMIMVHLMGNTVQINKEVR
ncbi:hypothetical protein RhiirA1_411609 [Rhizophagus irregularis]|uniref:Uncharacterized protein n=1 Tax=Rhizophagus irregularis TaxID=588596 RepID=A0A2N0SAN9_9GLOM|nr:hypothetical protein RhiirA1_411609 [Rhizophagus irregularis]